MTSIPLACNVQGDYGYKIIFVEKSDTIEKLISSAVEAVVGYLVPPFPEGTEFNAKVHGADEDLTHSTTIGDAELLNMETIDISVRTSNG